MALRMFGRVSEGGCPKRILGTLLLVVAVTMLANVLVRTIQVICDQLIDESDPRTECRGQLFLLSTAIDSAYLDGMTLHDVFGENGDDDRDGIGSLDEFLQMTLDGDVDCDGDGLDDGTDPCPNCHLKSYRGRVDSVVVKASLKPVDRVGAADEIVYVKLSYGASFDLDMQGYRFVAAEEWFYHHVRDHFRKRGDDFNNLDLEPVVFIPGLFYVYDVSLYCGGRCGWGEVFFLLDVPFYGPIFLGSKMKYVV